MLVTILWNMLILHVWASAPVPSPILVSGQPIEYHWSDGRKARLNFYAYGPMHLEVSADLTDNTCSEITTSHCTIGAGLKAYRVSLVWIENPIDPSRVGSVVMQNKDTPVEQVFIATMMKKIFWGLPYYQDIPNDILRCSDWSWLDGQNQEAPATLETPQWWGETMYPNPETGVEENIVFGSLSNVRWARSIPSTLQVTAIDGKYSSIYGMLDDFIYQSVTSLLIKRNSDFCQAAFKPDMVSYINALGQMGSLANQSLDYKFNQDSLFGTFIEPNFHSGKFLFSASGVPYEVY